MWKTVFEWKADKSLLSHCLDAILGEVKCSDSLWKHTLVLDAGYKDILIDIHGGFGLFV